MSAANQSKCSWETAKQTLDSNRVVGMSGIFDANLSDRSIILIQIRHTLLKRLPRKLRSRTQTIPPKQVAGLRAPHAFKYTRFHFSTSSLTRIKPDFCSWKTQGGQETQRGRKSLRSHRSSLRRHDKTVPLHLFSSLQLALQENQQVPKICQLLHFNAATTCHLLRTETFQLQ